MIRDTSCVIRDTENGTVITTVITDSSINGQLVAQQWDGVFTWIHADYLSDATRLTDVNGLEVHRLAYKAFGEAAENTGTGDDPKYTYTSKKQDSSGLYYYGARYYDPELGRWLSCDPALKELFRKRDAHKLIDNPMMLNHYCYSFNNPLKYRDPDGKEPVKTLADTTPTFINLFNTTPSKIGTKTGQDAENALIYLGSTEWSWKQFRSLPKAIPYFNERKGRYIHTQKGGWMDMTHFLFYAGRAYKFKKIENPKGGLFGKMLHSPIDKAMEEGHLQEFFDRKYSRYSYEDLPSDLYGAKFAVEYFDPNSKLSLGEQLEKYLTEELKATSPQEAPNWNSLPRKHHKYKPIGTNTTTEPMYPETD